MQFNFKKIVIIEFISITKVDNFDRVAFLRDF